MNFIEDYQAAEDPNCDCLPDCEKVTYKTEVSIVNLRADLTCNADNYARAPSMKSDYSSIHSLVYVRDIALPGTRHRQFYDRLTNDKFKLVDNEFYENIICRKMMTEQYALVIVQIRDPNLVQVIQNVKVTFSEKLGIAGGTVGLFTGLSFISVVEIIYWLLKFLWERIKVLKNMNKPTNSNNHNEQAYNADT